MFGGRWLAGGCSFSAPRLLCSGAASMWEAVRIEGRGWKREARRVFFVTKHCAGVSQPSLLYLKKKKNSPPPAQKGEGVHPADACVIRQVQSDMECWIMTPSVILINSRKALPRAKPPVTANSPWFSLPPRANGDDWRCLQAKWSQEPLRSQGGGWCVSELSCSYFPHITAFGLECFSYSGSKCCRADCSHSSIRSAISLVSLRRSARGIATINPPSKWNAVHNLPRWAREAGDRGAGRRREGRGGLKFFGLEKRSNIKLSMEISG